MLQRIPPTILVQTPNPAKDRAHHRSLIVQATQEREQSVLQRWARQQSATIKLLPMLVGAMAELRVGDRGLLATDVGPGIDPDALDALQAHVRRMEREAQLLYRGHLGEPCRHGAFIAPCAYEIESISRLDREFFGPILHVVRFRRQDLDFVIDSINGTGYGLTLGVHTRIDGTMEHIRRRMRVGNLYVNRSQIGAVVGVQPFGGERRWQDGKTERTRSGLDLCLF